MSDSPEFGMDVSALSVRRGESHLRTRRLAETIASEMGVELDDRVPSGDDSGEYVLWVSPSRLTLVNRGYNSGCSPSRDERILFWLDWGGAVGAVDVSLGHREVEVFRWLGPAV